LHTGRCLYIYDIADPELLQEAARLEREYPMQKIEAVQFEGLFDKRLQMYDVDLEMVKEEAKEQHEAIKRLQVANASFINARRGDQSTKQREQALQSLENAFYKYKEIIQNLDNGRKFYNDLAKIVSRFRDECRNFAYERKSEASQLEKYVSAWLVLGRFVGYANYDQRHFVADVFSQSVTGELTGATTAGRSPESAVRSGCSCRRTANSSDTHEGQHRTTFRDVDT
jgi:hypothetical protein